MGLRFSRSLRIISVVVLVFFIWSFGGIFDMAYAVKESGQHTANSSQGKNTTATQKPDEKFHRHIKQASVL